MNSTYLGSCGMFFVHRPVQIFLGYLSIRGLRLQNVNSKKLLELSMAAALICWPAQSMSDLPHASSSDGALPYEQGGAFVATRWSVVLKAGQRDSPEAEAALAQLCQTYWYPLYFY